jgi:MSHA biogenesis protein MshM
VPRLVNILAHKALLLVFGEGGRGASRGHVHLAALDTPAAAPAYGWWWPRLRATRTAE